MRIRVQRLRGPDGRGPAKIGEAQAYQFLSDVTRFADGFSLSLPELEGRGLIQSGDTLQLRIAGRVLATVRAEAVVGTTAEGGRRTAVTGRDLAGFLVDDAAPILHRDASTIGELAQLLIETTPVTTIVRQGISLATLRVHTEPGESRGAMLRRYLEFTGNLAWTDPAGRLVIGVPSKSPPIGRIRVRRGRTNVSACRVRRAPALALREVGIFPSSEADQSSGAFLPTRTVTVSSSDKEIAALGVVAVVEALDQADLEESRRLALNLLARAEQNALLVEASFAGHVLDGVIPRPDQTWRVDDDFEDVHEALYLRATRYVRGQDGQARTVMLLVRPKSVVGAFIGNQRDAFGLAGVSEAV